MKKTILAILMAMLATSAFAEGKCEGGDPFEGANDGHEYCISQKTMNWWSAFAWCQQQGRHLATLQEACDGWYGVTGYAACGNMVKSGVTKKYCWTANPKDSTNAWRVEAGTDYIDNGSRNGIASALCY